MDVLFPYCSRLKMDVSFEKRLDLSKLFLVDRVTYNNLIVIDSEDEIDCNKPIFRLTLEVLIKRAKKSYEREWGWKPIHNDDAKVCFYHNDFDKLVSNTLKWLEEHTDTKTGLVPTSAGKNTRMIYTIKCQPIGNIKHYTTMDEYKDE